MLAVHQELKLSSRKTSNGTPENTVSMKYQWLNLTSVESMKTFHWMQILYKKPGQFLVIFQEKTIKYLWKYRIMSAKLLFYHCWRRHWPLSDVPCHTEVIKTLKHRFWLWIAYCPLTIETLFCNLQTYVFMYSGAEKLLNVTFNYHHPWKTRCHITTPERVRIQVNIKSKQNT